MQPLKLKERGRSAYDLLREATLSACPSSEPLEGDITSSDWSPTSASNRWRSVVITLGLLGVGSIVSLRVMTAAAGLGDFLWGS